MTCGELRKYLAGFDPDEAVAALFLDLDKRLAYPVDAYQLMEETPVLLFELGKSYPLDEMVEEVPRNEHWKSVRNFYADRQR